jgi:hypothetical protein
MPLPAVKGDNHMSMTIRTHCLALSFSILLTLCVSSVEAQQKTITAKPQPSEVEKMAEKLEPSKIAEIQKRLDNLQALVPIPEPIDPSAHSNGCGPAWLPGFPLLINQQTFGGKDSVSKVNVSFTVNFKRACDLHDAGYAGLFVINRFGASPLDYGTYSKAAVDTKFFYDLCKICDETIPASNAKAREKCKGLHLGALAYYYAVSSKAGLLSFDCNPTLPGPPWKQPCTRAYKDKDLASAMPE